MYNEAFDLSISDTDVVIIPEQHLYHKPIATIPEMVNDNNDIIEELLKLLGGLCNPTVIFIGDIIHRGIKSTEDCYFIEDFFRAVNTLCCGRVFSVVGNHELSYRKNNPFWGVSLIKSNYVNNLIHYNYNVTSPLIVVVDDLVIGDVQYVFGHYDRCYYGKYDTGIDVSKVVLLSHNSLLTGDIIDNMSNKGVDLNVDYIRKTELLDSNNIPLTSKLKYVYVGHMHKAHGIYEVEEVIDGVDLNFNLHYLASLGRTNHGEYTDDVEREIPIHCIRNGLFEKEVYHNIMLPKREESVDERIVLENKESYDRQKTNRKLKKIESTTMDLINDVQDYIKNEPILLDWYQRSSNSDLDTSIIELLDKYLFKR